MKMLRVSFVVMLLLGVSAWAQQVTFELDPAKSRVEFMLDATMHTVHGSFRVKSGNVKFDAVTGTATGDIVVDATSAVTGNDSRDRKMHKEVLESARYPEIRLSVQSVRSTPAANGTSETRVSGALSLHGTEHSLELAGRSEVRDGTAVVDVDIVVPYVSWGMKDPSSFLLRVDKKVLVKVHAVGKTSSAVAK